ncbi:MAG: hypothetical protein ABI305_00720 [Tepidiformaceae bacterium]
MSDLATPRAAKSASLPADALARRLSITALTNRAIANRRERELGEYLGDEAGYLLKDLIAAETSEVAAKLLFTERLLAEGWDWPEILRSVWYREDSMREAANRE